jgi:hypothetical protein
MEGLGSKERAFADAAIGRERVYFWLSMTGVVVGLGTMGLAASRWVQGQDWGSTFVIAILVLLNGRQNLRQSKYARILRISLGASLEAEAGDDGQVV